MFNLSVLDQKKNPRSNEGGRKKKHLRKKTLNQFLTNKKNIRHISGKLTRATK